MREYWSPFDVDGFEMSESFKIITIYRLPKREDGVFGVIADEGYQYFGLTCENHKLLIPKGEYLCKRTNSPKFGNTFEITGVEGRDHILFHWGNIEDNSLGCILVGELFDSMLSPDGTRKIAVLSSKTTAGQGFLEFLARTVNIDKFKLVIEEWK